MSTSVGKYRFVRDAKNVSGIFSRNMASTDAMNVLHKWRGMESGRDFKVEVDEEEELMAVLTFETSDQAAGSQIDMLCAQHGVNRQFIA